MNPETAIRDASTLRLGQRLRRARLSRNLTQGEVAKNQFSVSYISAVERGQIRPSLGALEKLADRLQIPVIDLLGEAELEIKGTSFGEARDGGVERFRDEVDARLREARILSLQGKAEDAIALLARLSTQQLSLRESASVRLQLAAAYNRQGRADDARREAQEGLPGAERLSDADLVARLYAELGNAYSLLHSHALALDSYRASLRSLESSSFSDQALLFAVISKIGVEHAQLDEHDEALTYLQHASEAGRDVMNPERQGITYWSLSQAYAAKGNTAQARAYAMRSLAAYEEMANRRLVAQVYTRLGSEFVRAGQIDEAHTQLRAAYDIASAQQDARGIADAQRNLAQVYLQEHRLDDASTAAREALQRAEELEDEVQRAESLLVLAQVREQQRTFQEAESHYEEAVRLLQEHGTTERLRQAYAQYSEFLERRGENARAFEMLKQAYKSAARGGTPA